MFNNIFDKVTLNNGAEMPWIGFGVWMMSDGKEVEESVKYALEAGYRNIDTATIYGNEVGVGNAIKESGIKREEVFITSKVWNSDQGYSTTINAFKESLNRLQVDYLDLYLIHWPVEGKFNETWRALEEIYNDGLSRSIGVSNFMIHHLEKLLETAKIIPAINQIEFHPYLTQPDLIKFCHTHEIQVEAWSPIMKGNAGNEPTIVEVANKYNKTPTQVVLRWELQKRIITIPKSSNRDRIIENAQIFDFQLNDEDIHALDSLNKNYRYGADPYNFNF